MMRRDWALLCLIVMLAAVARLAFLDSPSRMVLDEYWYARDGCFYWRGSAAECGMKNLEAPDRDVPTYLARYGELTPEHPPLGKWLIGAPMKVFGFSPRPWRLASVGAGLLTVALLFLLVRKTTASTAAAAGAATLLAVDYPHYIHSRLAMLDIFVALFAVAAFYFCVLDREQIESRASGGPSHQRWRLAAGVAGGAAAACKLSGIAIALGVLLLVVAWEISAHRRSRVGASGLGKEVFSIVLLLLVVPLAGYMATYTGRLDGSLLAEPWAEESWLRAWVERQSLMLNFHADKPAGSTAPWALPMTEEPIPYVLEEGDERVREILLFGNPVFWWGGFAAVAYAATCWWRSDRWGTAPVVVIAFVAAYAAWLSITLTRRNVLLYHAVPIAPFLYFALANMYVHLWRPRPRRIAAAAIVGSAVIAFAFFFPILTARPLALQAWRVRACSAQALWLERAAGCGLANTDSRSPGTGAAVGASPSLTRRLPLHARPRRVGSQRFPEPESVPNAVRGRFVGTGSARASDDRVPRTGSARTASGPEGSSANDSFRGAAASLDPSTRRSHLRSATLGSLAWLVNSTIFELLPDVSRHANRKRHDRQRRHVATGRRKHRAAGDI